MTTKEVLEKLEASIDALDSGNAHNDVFVLLMSKAKNEARTRCKVVDQEYPATVLFELQQLLRGANCDRLNEWFSIHGFSLLGPASCALCKTEEAFNASTKIAIVGGMLCAGMVVETFEIWKGIFSLFPNI